MWKYKITFISDTHGSHNSLTNLLDGGDYLIHSGDISSLGGLTEIKNFLEWFNNLNQYTHKIFIAGNHDFWFEENDMLSIETLIKEYPNIRYLQDSYLLTSVDDLPQFKIYGSPWQPKFYNWAFNLPRNGEKLKQKWEEIPEDTDLLITHGPPLFVLDKNNSGLSCGCELLEREIFNRINPKIHLFGHIHEGYGYVNRGNTHFINASNLDYRNIFSNPPINVEWDPITNEIDFKK